MPSRNPTPQSEDNSASIQALVLFGVIILLGMVVFANPSGTSREMIATFPDNDLITNPQVNEDEFLPTVATSRPMFELENANGWDTPTTVTLVGTFQNQIGCDANMAIDCSASHMTYDSLGDIWRASYQLSEGDYTYRVHLDDSDTHIFGKNGTSGEQSFAIDLSLDRSQTVNFYFDHKTGWITDDVNSLILTLPSNFQNRVGCQEEWNAGCFRTWLQDIEGDGIYTYETLLIPNGSWEVRVAQNGNMDTSYGEGGTFTGGNIPLWIPNIGHLTVFTWDSNLKTLTIFASNVPIRLSTDLPIPAPNE